LKIIIFSIYQLMFSSKEIHTLYFTNCACTAVSILAELYVIWLYISKWQKNWRQKLLVSLVFSNLVYSLSNLFVLVHRDTLLCNLEGFLRASSIISSTLWIVFLVWSSYNNAVSPNRKDSFNYPTFLLSNIFFGTVTAAAVLFAQGFYGYPYFGKDSTGLTCSFSSFDVEVLTVDFPIVLYILLISILLFKMSYSFSNRDVGGRMKEYNHALKYPFLAFLSWLPCLMNILSYVLQGNSVFWVTALNVYISRLTGFLVCFAIVMGLKKEHRFNQQFDSYNTLLSYQFS